MSNMSDYCVSPWRTWFNGIEHAAGLSSTAFGVAVKREQNAHMVRISLRTPGLAFYTTPNSGPYQTQQQTIFDFLTSACSVCNVRLAINAALGWAGGQDDVGAPASLFGLAKSRGTVVCDPTVPAPQPNPVSQPDVPDSTSVGTVALILTQDNRASFQVINAQQPGEGSPWASAYTAVAGSPQPRDGVLWPPGPFVGGLVPGEAMVLRGGKNNGIPSADGTDGEKIAGRTAVGLSQDGSYLFLLTIDGVEGASPQYGATFHDVGEWLRIMGAHDGITLDGGGSTAMAILTDNNQPTLVNIPHGTEGPPYIQRANAQFFGVAPGT